MLLRKTLCQQVQGPWGKNREAVVAGQTDSLRQKHICVCLKPITEASVAGQMDSLNEGPAQLPSALNCTGCWDEDRQAGFMSVSEARLLQQKFRSLKTWCGPELPGAPVQSGGEPQESFMCWEWRVKAEVAWSHRLGLGQ